MTSQQVVVDPWVEAMNPTAPAQAYWGQMHVAARLVCLVKGIGKVDYTEGAVMPDGSEPRPVTAVKLDLDPLPEMKLQWGVEREPIAAAWGEWGEITLPSLRELGLTELPTLDRAWVKVEMASTGSTYTNKKGDTRDRTAFKFLKLFGSEAACRADYQATQGTQGAQSGDAAKPAPARPATPVTPTVAAPAAAPSNGNGNGGSKDQETALKFAKVYVANACRGAGGDLEKAREALAPILAAQPLISKYFTVDSPEIIELMAAAL